MHQLQSLKASEFPEDFSHAVVFTTHGLERLQYRIEELQREIETYHSQSKAKKREIVGLKKDKETKEKEVHVYALNLI